MSNFNSIKIVGFEKNKKHENRFLNLLHTYTEENNFFSDDSDKNELEIIKALDDELHSAYENSETKSLQVIHFALSELLERKFLHHVDSIELSPLMFKIQQRIFSTQLKKDL